MESAQLVQALKERGYRVTPQRLEVINIVLEKLMRREHPTFNDILNEVKQRMPSISASTVYSILKLLEDSGYVVSFEHNGRTYYDSVTPHVNVMCVNENKVIDIEDAEVIDLLKKRGIHPVAITVKAVCAGSQ
ncbi:Fur family transcriptional regulator [Pyrobaculum aerophilum]|uniref:Ferric uptake regulator, putative n=2 Tax=Pyrobaculum aerophilum TaxID=13773 RepID=Q8ZVF6_PYRAE|nr:MULTISPECIES: Fur family transcriptional regulator [Pyrobaculum]AAL64100.1 ferric uptake regulator, putative [Pyrobaculum aerophilum str. IM2]MCX8135849.1 transcriptional repressor [Pyrobaculum aerophilum]RFA94891.1 transcriptional repressor [Pyrobaculum aerophilum]RFB00100.1 transcriptional repressor [Pyrobaculum aerophilum]HII47136.1 transcriptional repressor [Pyrobaculum aerophilum]